MTACEFWDGFALTEIAVEVKTLDEKREVCAAAADMGFPICDWVVETILESYDPDADLGGAYVSFDTVDQVVTGFYSPNKNSFRDNILSYADFLAIQNSLSEDSAEVFDSSLDGLF
mgnify:CR=1 FL=1